MMSLRERQKTCPACGEPLLPEQQINIEPLIDGEVRYIAIHWGESTFVRYGDLTWLGAE